ncbi:hypothetical protein EYF80_054040 [Liparis tanakae]|uniref:Uncharacterized protein n=1 Tax=Liparis tanakae TaxID=230148 RepID=A0A4Z2F3I5_9TELE|nr:hypothetical protein EYF80_054040 [Liparis tanakae]
MAAFQLGVPAPRFIHTAHGPHLNAAPPSVIWCCSPPPKSSTFKCKKDGKGTALVRVELYIASPHGSHFNWNFGGSIPDSPGPTDVPFGKALSPLIASEGGAVGQRVGM